MKKLLPILVPLVKWSGVAIALVAKVAALLPESFAFYGLLAFAIISSVKDTALKVGDILDDGKDNDSFNP